MQDAKRFVRDCRVAFGFVEILYVCIYNCASMICIDRIYFLSERMDFFDINLFNMQYMEIRSVNM